jgi:hypothetical protein
VDVLADHPHLLSIFVEQTDDSVDTALHSHHQATSMREMCSVIDSFFSLSGTSSSAIDDETLLPFIEL